MADPARLLASAEGAEAMKRPKPLMHAKTTRRQQRYFGDLSPQDFARHDRKLADLRRADAVNDISLEATARRLATVFPQKLDPESYLKVVRDFLDKAANTISDRPVRSTRQRRHQKALRLLRAITLGGEGRAAYCDAQEIDLADANWMLAHLCSKDDELRCAVDFISAHGTGTSSQNRQVDDPACHTIWVGNDSTGVTLTPAVRLAVKTPQGAKVLVFPNLRSVDFTGTSSQNRQADDPACHTINRGKSCAFLVGTAQVGDCTWTLYSRGEPPKDWQGIEGVFEPGNETVTVGKDDDDRVGVHSLTRDGKWIEEIADTGDPGLQRPGDRWVRVGPRAIVEARKAGEVKRVNVARQYVPEKRAKQIKVPRLRRRIEVDLIAPPPPWNIRFDFHILRTNWRRVGGRVDGFKTDDGCRCRVRPRQTRKLAPAGSLLTESEMLFHFDHPTT